MVIHQAKSVSPYSVTLTTTVHVVVGMDGHVITVICSGLAIPDMGGGVVKVSSRLILIDVFETFERIQCTKEVNMMIVRIALP